MPIAVRKMESPLSLQCDTHGVHLSVTLADGTPIPSHWKIAGLTFDTDVGMVAVTGPFTLNWGIYEPSSNGQRSAGTSTARPTSTARKNQNRKTGT